MNPQKVLPLKQADMPILLRADKLSKIWSGQRDSNPQDPRFELGMSATFASQPEMVDPLGFEPR